MFGVSKEELLQGMENLRKRICHYDGPTCDCKYGHQWPEDTLEQLRQRLNISTDSDSEQTGCPELRQAYALLNALTEEEFDNLCRKTYILI
jgi:hypothetical protein